MSEILKLAYSYSNGHDIYWDGYNWRYEDTNEIISHNRKCPRCNQLPTEQGHDSCLGELKGVKFACCGHGIIDRCYITFDDGKVIRGIEAVKYINNLKVVE